MKWKCIACHRAWTRRKKAARRPGIVGTTAPCAYCSKPFAVRRIQQRYCAPRCRRAAELDLRIENLQSRPGRCEACGRAAARTVWDHDHITGKFRGWLCNGCNSALGFAYDDPATLRALAEYLEQRKEAFA